MAAIASQSEISDKLRTFLPSVEERKGLILSHLLGFALFSEFALNVLKFSLPFTPANSIPIRLIAIYLLIDRTGRLSRLRFGTWDYILLGFIFLTGIGCIFTAATAPSVPVNFEDYRRFVGLFLNAYIYYLVAKEGLNRRGFRPDITVKWVLAGLGWSAMVGIMQALNLFGARNWSGVYANSLLTNLREANSEDANVSFASGTATWWTSMALEMLVGFALVFSPTFRRRPYWWEWCLGLLFMAAFMATQSRGGLLAFGACAVATFFWYIYHKKYLLATIIGTTVTVAVTIWVFAVFALHIEKFVVSLKGEKVQGSEYTQSLTGRLEQQKELINIGLRQPMFGTGPNFSLLAGPGAKFNIWSNYSHVGPIDTMYGYMFAQFGVVGLGFLVIMQGYFIFFMRKATAYRPYAFAAFFIGVGFSVHGLAEFLLYSRTFIVMNLLAAYAGSAYLANEEGRAPFKRLVKTPWPVGPKPAAIPAANPVES